MHRFGKMTGPCVQWRPNDVAVARSKAKTTSRVLEDTDLRPRPEIVTTLFPFRFPVATYKCTGPPVFSPSSLSSSLHPTIRKMASNHTASRLSLHELQYDVYTFSESGPELAPGEDFIHVTPIIPIEYRH
jgi:hypothetical protein